MAVQAVDIDKPLTTYPTGAQRASLDQRAYSRRMHTQALRRFAGRQLHIHKYIVRDIVVYMLMS